MDERDANKDGLVDDDALVDKSVRVSRVPTNFYDEHRTYYLILFFIVVILLAIILALLIIFRRVMSASADK